MIVLSPILNRELLTFLRSKRAFVGLLLFLLVLCVGVGLAWLEAAPSASRSANRDAISRSLFHVVTVSQLLVFSAYALILSCTKVNSERNAKTLDMLASLPVTGRHVILAKYGSVLLILLLLIVSSAPFLSICFLFGGVGWQETLSAYCVIVVTVLSYGMIGLACSAVFRKVHIALIAGFLLALVFYGGIPVVVVFLVEVVLEDLFRSMRGLEKVAFGVFQTPSPLVTYLLVCTDTWRRVPASAGGGLVLHVAFALVVFVVSFLVARSGYRSMTTSLAGPVREQTRRPRPRASGTDLVVYTTQVHRRPLPLKPIRDHANPVSVKDSRLLLSWRWEHRAIRFILAAIFFVFVWAMVWMNFSRSEYTFHHQMCGVGAATALLTCLLVPLLSAQSVSSERESHTLPLLTATLLRPRQILLGKLMVLLRYAFRTQVLFTLPFLLLFFGYRDAPVREVFADWIKILMPLFAITVFVTSIGLLCSVLCRKTVTAAMLAYGVVLALAFSPLLCFIVYFNLGWGGQFLEDVFAFVIPIFSPVFYFVREADMKPWQHNQLWGTILFYVVLLLAMSAGILRFAAARFRRESSPATRRN